MSGKVHERNGIRIRTFYICPPIPMRQFDWCAVDDEHYDGSPDSKTKDEVGFGATEDEAIEKLLMIAFQPSDDFDDDQTDIELRRKLDRMGR